MFTNIFSMMGNYEARKVDRYEEGDTFISTAAVSDSDKPYETAVAHPEYNGGKIVIVETYDTFSDAYEGHKRWVEKMTAEELPVELFDMSEAGVANLLDLIDTDNWRRYPRQKKGDTHE